MNILFINSFNVSPNLGGTERITDTLSREFINSFHHNCYLAYYSEIDKCFTRTKFTATIHLKNYRDYAPLFNFIIEYKINIVILQGQFRLAKILKSQLKESNIKIFFAHHLYPGVEKQSIKLSYFLPKEITSANVLKTLIKTILYPILKISIQIKYPIYYKNAYTYADKTILLSTKLVKPFMEFGNITNNKKFAIIPNALSFNTFFPICDLNNKENIILIVSRLVENPKRISLAIKAWEDVSKEINNWRLIIVGTGKDEDVYKNYCETKNIPNIFFAGNQNPEPFYQKASIFLMTSRLESWGLTITEAQQFGVVPIAFNSYPSLTDIINPQNGIIVSDNDLSAYIKAIKYLIRNKNARKNLAINAIESSKKFKSDIIAKQWIELMKE